MFRGNATSAHVLAVCLAAFSLSPGARADSLAVSRDLRLVRVVHPKDLLDPVPGAIPVLPDGAIQIVPHGDGGATLVITVRRDDTGSDRISRDVGASLGIAIDAAGRRLFHFEGETVTEVPLDGVGEPIKHHVGSLDLPRVHGMSYDALTGRLGLLDAQAGRLALVDPEGGIVARLPGTERETGSWIALDGVPADVRGMASDPATGRLHLLVPTEGLLELDAAGRIAAVRAIPGEAPREPIAVLFAPSSDATDDDAVMNFYVADGATGTLTEYSLLSEPPVTQALTYTSTLVRVIDTSKWSPPSPDPAGIAWLPATGTLLVSDSEVNEMPIFTGDNLYEMTLSGSLIDTETTLPWSDEPAGLDYDHPSRTLYVADDTGPRVVHVVRLGGDGILGTSDDVVTTFSTSAFGSDDPEGVAFGAGALYVVDGVNAEIYRLLPGANGKFDGVPPSGDDTVSHFDVSVHGVTDPEGIAYNAANGHLYAIGKPAGRLIEMTTSGSLVQVIDVSAAAAGHAAGLAVAPGSNSPGTRNMYMVARGVDNDSDPQENDGKAYEMTLPSSSCGSDAECNDALFCNGVESCVSGSCQSGANPCPGLSCDEGADLCSPCDNDGQCELDENCDNCPNDCIGADPGCGNGFCEPGLGEDCLSCPQDCAGRQSGQVDRRFCCGDGAGTGAVGCGDPRCNASGYACSATAVEAYCCGDAVCGGAEDPLDCSLDCGPAPTCGDQSCDTSSGEDRCSCSPDCGAPPSVEATCSNGQDDDCDGLVDGIDPDCCSAGKIGDSCSGDGDCCSGHCRGRKGAQTCR